MSKPKIGNLAPSFKLSNQNNEEIDLKKLKGKIVILYFYPKAMTPGCTVQACSIRDHKKDFDKKKISVLAVSPDSVTRLKKFEEKEKLNFDLLSDEDHGIAEKYGVWAMKKFMGREFMGILRTTFIIDQEGRIAHIMDKVNTKTHHSDALDWIKENL